MMPNYTMLKSVDLLGGITNWLLMVNQKCLMVHGRLSEDTMVISEENRQVFLIRITNEKTRQKDCEDFLTAMKIIFKLRHLGVDLPQVVLVQNYSSLQQLSLHSPFV